MLDVQKRKRSWLTQRIANRFPPWSRLRKCAQSVGQQILEPAALELQDLYWQTTYVTNNKFISSADYDQLQGISKLPLPPEFEFDTTEKSGGDIYHAPSSVVGTLSDASEVTLSLATDNSLREFWYGVPTRITYSGDSVAWDPVVPETEAENLSSISPTAVRVPGKLWITLSGNSIQTHRYGGGLNRASVYLEGIDVFGRKAKEVVRFAYNGKVKTKIDWEEITLVQTEYIDDTATIRVDWLPVGNSEHIDTMGLNILPNREKFRFFTLGLQSYGSTLQSWSFAADNFYSVLEGNDEKDLVYEMELLDSAGSNITATWMSLWPHRFWTVTTDASQLHFHYPERNVGDLAPTADRTPECIVQIETSTETYVRGDTISLDTNVTRPFWRILRYRWSTVKPDGTRVGISLDGTEIAYSESAWVDAGEKSFTKVGYQENPISYLLAESGQYTFYLETIIKDNLRQTDTPVFQTDVLVVLAETNTALASISLPSSVGLPTYISFDAYGRPWVVSSNGTAYRLTFHYDYYLIDFTNKVLLMREPYSRLVVTA